MSDPTVLGLMQRDPRVIVIEDDMRRWSRGELAGVAGGFAASLLDRGVQPGERVVVHGRSDGGLVAALLGARAVGALALMLPPGVAPEAWAKRWRAVTVVDARVVPPAAALPRDPPESGGVGIATSGTTGEPKVVALTASGIRAMSDLGFGDGTPQAGERMWCSVPICHMYGFSTLVNTLGSDGIFRMTDGPITPEDVRRLGPDVEVLATVPSLVSTLDSARRLRMVMLAGDTISGELRKELVRRLPGVSFTIRFGMTEAGGRVLALSPERFAQGTASVGEPAPGVEVRLSEEGELLVRSPLLPEGYLDDPAGTAARWQGGWARSGDRFEHHEDGYHHVGRMDLRFKRRGEWISPERVEAALGQHPAVIAALVQPERRADEVVAVARVELREPGVDGAQLRAFLRPLLRPIEVPVEISVVDLLPRTANGKLSRRSLG